MISISGCLYKRTFRGIVPWGTSAFSDLSALWMFSNICFFLIVARGNFYSHRTKRPRRFPEEIGESSGVFIYLNFLLTYRIRSLNKVGSQGYISHAVYLRSWTSTKMKHFWVEIRSFLFFFIRKNYFWGSKCSHIHTRKVTHTSTAERNGLTPETIILPFVWALQVSARGGRKKDGPERSNSRVYLCGNSKHMCCSYLWLLEDWWQAREQVLLLDDEFEKYLSSSVSSP